MLHLWKRAQHFLDDTLGMALGMDEEAIDGRFPLHVGRRYVMAKATIEGVGCVLMSPREELPPWNQWKLHGEMVQAHMECPVVLVMDRIPPAHRRHLVKHRGAFLVPGLEIYLPMVASAYRQRGQGVKPRTPETLRPATQALFLYLLYYPGDQDRSTRELAEQVGYSPMSMSRALEELDEHELLGQMESRRRRRTLWQRAQDHLQHPVKQTIACRYPPALEQRFTHSGEAALEAYTNLVGNGPPRLALTTEQWKAHRDDEERLQSFTEKSFLEESFLEESFLDQKLFQVTHDDIRTSAGVEIWRYAPVRPPDCELIESVDGRPMPRWVDPLSLALIYANDPDPRVQGAYEQLVERALDDTE